MKPCVRRWFFFVVLWDKKSWKWNFSSKINCSWASADKGLTELQVYFPAQMFNCCRPEKHLRESGLLVGTLFFKGLSESRSFDCLYSATRNWVCSQNSNVLILLTCPSQQFSISWLPRFFCLLINWLLNKHTPSMSVECGVCVIAKQLFSNFSFHQKHLKVLLTHRWLNPA